MTAPTVTFETKCYEKDEEILLKTDRLEAMMGTAGRLLGLYDR